MAVIEVDGLKLDEYKLMQVRVRVRGGGEARLILPSASWNASGEFKLHELTSGRVSTVDNIVELLRQEGKLDDVVVKD